jgi:5-methylcytosine-specific restriction endonuclease McrA
MKQVIASSSPRDGPETTEELISRLRALRAERRALSVVDRQRVHAKTAGRCHICGGIVDEGWQADHVLAHSGGGGSEADNYLAAHTLCNNYRWDYLPEASVIA